MTVTKPAMVSEQEMLTLFDALRESMDVDQVSDEDINKVLAWASDIAVSATLLDLVYKGYCSVVIQKDQIGFKLNEAGRAAGEAMFSNVSTQLLQ
jgi:hypothetical protein